jgi:energy-coupling factor transporter ATP-binding protein EcfA2
MNIFKRFNEVGVTVLVATHDIHLIERYGVRRVVIEGGRVAGGADAPPTASLAPASLAPASLVSASPAPESLPSIVAERGDQL